MSEADRLYDRQSRRKFLTPQERAMFIDSAQDLQAERRTFCLTLAYTGCRLQEACEIANQDIDLVGEAIFVGGDDDRRAVPVPGDFAAVLDAVHGVRRVREDNTAAGARGLWPIDRTTASRWVKQAMNQADIVGPHANAKGLRHAFALEQLRQGVQPRTVQTWLGGCDDQLIEAYSDVLEKRLPAQS
jgi:integrase